MRRFAHNPRQRSIAVGMNDRFRDYWHEGRYKGSQDGLAYRGNGAHPTRRTLEAMFSSRKVLIKLAEVAALAGVITCLASAFLVERGRLEPEQVQPFTFPGMVYMASVFWVCFALTAEFRRLRGGATESTRFEVNLSFSDMKMLLRWCPAFIMLSYPLAVGVAIYTIFSVGFGVSWRTGEAFAKHHALGFSLFGALMLLMLLPVLASAARMPGTYAEHFHPRLRGGNTP